MRRPGKYIYGNLEPVVGPAEFSLDLEIKPMLLGDDNVGYGSNHIPVQRVRVRERTAAVANSASFMAFNIIYIMRTNDVEAQC